MDVACGQVVHLTEGVFLQDGEGAEQDGGQQREPDASDNIKQVYDRAWKHVHQFHL